LISYPGPPEFHAKPPEPERAVALEGGIAASLFNGMVPAKVKRHDFKFRRCRMRWKMDGRRLLL
jgi:hypothetical protein